MVGKRFLVALTVLALGVAACSDGTAAGPVAAGEERVTVLPDLEAPMFVVNVYATDAGYEQPIVFVPAGRFVKLIFRNHGSVEHHYRVIGLVPSQLRWMVFPMLDEYDIATMSADELRSHGFDPDAPIDDLDHVLHHLGASFSPVPPASTGAIRPLGTEVHAITRRSKQDVVFFRALTTGTYDVVNSAHPEIRGTLVVYLPPDATIATTP